MAAKAKPVVKDPNVQMVEVMIPRGGGNEDPNFFVSVNGVNYLLPKGKRSLVPQHIAFEINRAWAAQEAQDARMQAMIDAANV